MGKKKCENFKQKKTTPGIKFSPWFLENPDIIAFPGLDLITLF